MQRLTWHFGNRGPSWLFDLLFGPEAGLLTNRWWHLAALTIGCFSGCSSLRETQETVAQPFQATRDLAARAGDQIGDALGFDRPLPLRVPGSRSWRSEDARSAAKLSLASKAPSDQNSRARSLATPNSRAIAGDNKTPKANSVAESPPRVASPKPKVLEALPPRRPIAETTTTSATVAQPSPHATHLQKPSNNTTPNSLRLPSAPAPIGPPEPLSAPAEPLSAPAEPLSVPAEPLSVTPVAASSQIPPPADHPTNVAWCRVRLRNVSSQPVTQVAVTMTTPPETQLVASAKSPAQQAVRTRLDFPAITQVAPNEEITFCVGAVATDESTRRLRIQVRDTQGGSNQEVQTRWQVTIDPIDAP